MAVLGSQRVVEWSPAASAGWAYLTQHVTKGGFAVSVGPETIGLNRVRGTSQVSVAAIGPHRLVTVHLAYRGDLEDVPSNVRLTRRRRRRQSQRRRVVTSCSGARMRSGTLNGNRWIPSGGIGRSRGRSMPPVSPGPRRYRGRGGPSISSSTFGLPGKGCPISGTPRSHHEPPCSSRP